MQKQAALCISLGLMAVGVRSTPVDTQSDTTIPSETLPEPEQRDDALPNCRRYSENELNVPDHDFLDYYTLEDIECEVNSDCDAFASLHGIPYACEQKPATKVCTATDNSETLEDVLCDYDSDCDSREGTTYVCKQKPQDTKVCEAKDNAELLLTEKECVVDSDCYGISGFCNSHIPEWSYSKGGCKETTLLIKQKSATPSAIVPPGTSYTVKFDLQHRGFVGLSGRINWLFSGGESKDVSIDLVAEPTGEFSYLPFSFFNGTEEAIPSCGTEGAGFSDPTWHLQTTGSISTGDTSLDGVWEYEIKNLNLEESIEFVGAYKRIEGRWD